MRTQFWGGSQTAPSTSALNFGSLVQAGRGFLATEASAAQVCSVAGTLHSFRVRLTTAPGTSKQYTLTIRKNGADTGLTMVISGAATTGFIASPVAVAAGDWLTMSITPSGTPSATGIISWASSFDSTNANESPLLSCMFGNTLNVTSATGSVSVQGTNASTTTAVNADGIVPVAGTITGFRVRFPAAVSAGSWQILLVKNGVDTAITATVTGGAQVATSSGSAVVFAAGDLIRFRVQGSSTPVAQGISIGATFAPTVDGGSFMIGGQQSLSNSSSLFWYFGPNPDGGNATVINRHTLSNACVITALYAQAKTTPLGGDTWTYNLNVNEVQVATVVTSSASVVSSTGLSITLADADRVELGHVPAGTPAASISIWSVAVFIQPGVASTNESGEASALTGFNGYQGPASTNESGEASAAVGVFGQQGTSSTNESGEASALNGFFGQQGDVETDSAGLTSSGLGFHGVTGDAQTDSNGDTTTGVGQVGQLGDIETDSGGLSTAGSGTFGITGDAQTDSDGITTDGSGTSGSEESTVQTDQGGLETTGQGSIGPAPVSRKDESGWSKFSFSNLRRRFRPRPQRVVVSRSVEGVIRASSAANTTQARGMVGRPPVAAPVVPLLPPARPAPPRKRKAKPSKPNPFAIVAVTGRASTNSPGLSSRAEVQVWETEEEMLLAAIMTMEL